VNSQLAFDTEVMSLGVNPCYTVYALSRYIAQGIPEEIHG